MRKFHLALAFFMVAVGSTFFADSASSDEKPAAKTTEATKATRPSLPTGKMDAAEWMKASTAPLAPGEIDRLVNAQLAKIGVKPAPLTNDLEFLRRVYLDTTGHLPTPGEVGEFLPSESAPGGSRQAHRQAARLRCVRRSLGQLLARSHHEPDD